MHDNAYIGRRSENNINASCMTISGGRTKQLNIFCRVTGFTSDFLSFIVVELIRFFHGAIQLWPCTASLKSLSALFYGRHSTNWLFCITLIYMCFRHQAVVELVPASGQWYLAAEKVTLGLASHCACITDINASPFTGSSSRRGRWLSAYALWCSMVNFTSTFFYLVI